MRRNYAPAHAGIARRAVILALAALLAFATLAACGDDDDSSASGSPAATTEAPADGTAATAPPVTEQPSPGESGVHNENIGVDGRGRSWRLYVPESLPDGPVPLVVGLHGGAGSGEQFARTSGFDEQADAGGFIAAYPNGIGVFPVWNGGRCCGVAVSQRVNDVKFIEQMVAAISDQYEIDPDRVFAAGHSNGGIMALRLACESSLFRAAGAVAGSLEVDACAPTSPVSLLLIHGDADTNHPLGGGRGVDSIADIDFRSVADSMAILAPAMGCSTETATSADGAITTTTWQGCPEGIRVEQQVIAGANHAWPGGGPSLVGTPSDALDATAELWEFFDSQD
jgi:polyhydroxybutyrate depolymerase